MKKSLILQQSNWLKFNSLIEALYLKIDIDNMWNSNLNKEKKINKNMNTEAMLKGTFIINNCYWDGGTCFYYGINYMVIDC